MIELGVREFRQRFSEVANGTEMVRVTSNGVEVGVYQPKGWSRDLARARAAARAVAQARQELEARGVDLDAALAGIGLTPMGEPLED